MCVWAYFTPFATAHENNQGQIRVVRLILARVAKVQFPKQMSQMSPFLCATQASVKTKIH